MSGKNVEALRARTVIGSVVRICRTSWQELALLGLALFIPLGFLSALAPGDGIEIDRLDDPHLVPVILVGVAQIVAPLIGTVLFAGIAASAVMRDRTGQGHGVREIASSLPYAKLIAADILLVLAMAVGLVLLVVPGVIALVWFCLVAPAIEYEGGTVRSGFRRSRELVRGHFRQVAILVVPAVLLQSVIEGAAETAAFAALGHGFGAEWLAAVVGNLLADPVFALVVVILYLDLREMERAST